LTFPDWNMAGVVPPIRPNQPGHSPDRSPYATTLTEVVDRFSTSPERIAILDGFLAYRRDLHAVGLTDGFQWLDGSFLEDVENQRGRPPNDIDIVTYFNMPSGVSQHTLVNSAVDLFKPSLAKAKYKVDAYSLPLGEALSARHVGMISYWYSMWSHRRSDDLWKGFVQIDLAPLEDSSASKLLDHKKTGGP